MIEQYISFETAILAKEKGFPQNRDVFYTKELGLCHIGIEGEFLSSENSKEIWYDCNGEFEGLSEKFGAKSQSMLQKWLREEHNIHISIFYDHFSKTFEYDVCEKVGESWNNEAGKTYEDALEKGLIVALKLVK